DRPRATPYSSPQGTHRSRENRPAAVGQDAERRVADPVAQRRQPAEGDSGALARQRGENIHAQFPHSRGRHWRQGGDLRSDSPDRRRRRRRHIHLDRGRGIPSRVPSRPCFPRRTHCGRTPRQGRHGGQHLESGGGGRRMNATTSTRDVAGRPRLDFTVLFARFGTLASLIALLIAFSLARSDVFPTVNNLLNIMSQISILGTMAFGLTVCLVMGLFDLSIAAMATLGGYVATFLLVQYPDTVGVPEAVAASLITAALIGIVNGLIVSYLGISAFIATLVTGSIITGAGLGISDSKTDR